MAGGDNLGFVNTLPFCMVPPFARGATIFDIPGGRRHRRGVKKACAGRRHRRHHRK